MSDMERVELAMRKVAQHKCKDVHISNGDWKLLAEAAVKMMWLIENESNEATDEK